MKQGVELKKIADVLPVKQALISLFRPTGREGYIQAILAGRQNDKKLAVKL